MIEVTSPYCIEAVLNAPEEFVEDNEIELLRIYGSSRVIKILVGGADRRYYIEVRESDSPPMRYFPSENQKLIDLCQYLLYKKAGVE